VGEAREGLGPRRAEGAADPDARAAVRQRALDEEAEYLSKPTAGASASTS